MLFGQLTPARGSTTKEGVLSFVQVSAGLAGAASLQAVGDFDFFAGCGVAISFTGIGRGHERTHTFLKG